MSLVARTLMALKMDRRALPNRIGRGHVCASGRDFPNNAYFRESMRSPPQDVKDLSHMAPGVPSIVFGKVSDRIMVSN
jgi:hypothetical protein